MATGTDGNGSTEGGSNEARDQAASPAAPHHGGDATAPDGEDASAEITIPVETTRSAADELPCAAEAHSPSSEASAETPHAGSSAEPSDATVDTMPLSLSEVEVVAADDAAAAGAAGAASEGVDMEADAADGVEVEAVEVPSADAALPTITQVEPAEVPLCGGTKVRITLDAPVALQLAIAHDASAESEADLPARGLVVGRVLVGGLPVAAELEGDRALVAHTPALRGEFADIQLELADGRVALAVRALRLVAPPRIARVAPERVALFGGRVQVFGERFVPGCEVRLGAKLVAAELVAPDELAFYALPRALPCRVAVTVTNPDGQSDEATISFEEGPVIESVEPAVAHAAGGVRVVVRGRGFSPGVAVSLFDAVAPEVSLVSDEEFAFVTPAVEAQRGSVRVTRFDGLAAIASFEVIDRPAPRVHEVVPSTGWVIGGTRVTLVGTELQGGRVWFGEEEATILEEGNERLVVASPAIEAPGAVSLRLERADTKRVELPAGFVYAPVPAPPKILSLSPPTGFTTGGQTVAVHGDNFDERTRLRLDGVGVPVRFASRTLLEFTTPLRPEPGVVDLEAIAADEVVVTAPGAFEYKARPLPVIAGVTPGKGLVTGGFKVTIEGEHFFPEYWVRIGRERPTAMPARSATQLVVVVPARAQVGFVDVEVGVGEAVLATKKNAFQYEGLPAPALESVSPNRAGTAGGAEITLTGKNFVAGTLVTFGGKPVKSQKLVDAKTLDVKIPPGEHGKMVDVVVKNPDGKEAILRRAFQYDSRY